MKRGKIAELFKNQPGCRLKLKEHRTDCRDAKEFRDVPDEKLKAEAKAYMKANLGKLSHAQELLWASDSYSLLIIFQAMDAAGKDSMIKHVMSGVNPQGVHVASFKKPSDEELDHNYLWRYQEHLPQRGQIGIFNRSYYEEVLVVRVHPELLEPQKLPAGKRGENFWKERYEDINCFERHLVRNGTVILKFFLNVSPQEQKKRFIERLTDPAKHWKFNAADLEDRKLWKDYMRAYEEAITATSTDWAPWYIIPADHKWTARAAVSGIISREIERLDLKPPKLTAAQQRELIAARKQLESE